MDVFVILSVLTVLGIGETLYLIRTRHKAEQPICLTGHDCTKVLTSKYNRIFGIHNDVAGLLFYIVALAITVHLIFGIGDSHILLWGLRVLVGGSALTSLALIFVQWKLIKAWCTWCLASAATNILMAAILLYQFMQ